MRKNALCIALIAVVIATLCCFFTTGCGRNTPEGVVRHELDTAQNVSESDLLAALEGRPTSDLGSNIILEGLGVNEDIESGAISPEQAQSFARFVAKMADFDYTIDNVAVSEDEETAVVTVTFTTYDFSTLYADAMETALNDVLENNDLMSMSASDIQAASVEAFNNAINAGLDALQEKTVTAAAAEFNLTKIDGKWTLSSITPEALNAMVGGMVASTEALYD